MNPYTRLVVLLSLQLGVTAGIGACGEGDEPDGSSGVMDAGLEVPPATTTDTLRLVYSPMFSALVEGQVSQLPVRLDSSYVDTSGAQFSSADPAIAEVVQTADGVIITAKKEGRVSIKVALNDKTGSAVLTIKKYTQAQWLLGEARYKTKERAVIPTDGGPPSAILFATDPGSRNMSGGCNTCHASEAQILQLEDTPMQTAGYTDDELITIFTKGEKPEWVYRKASIPSFLWGPNHAWTVSEEEKWGLVAYLRTKPPKRQPPSGSGLRICGDAGTDSPPPLCDLNGNLVVAPGRRDGDAAGLPRTDAGQPRAIDGGMSDAGV